jgi:hypothetical protein
MAGGAVSLTTLLLGFAPVAALFLAVAWLSHGRRLNTAALCVVLGEALVLTLLAALWFDSLGHGGWWLIFLLLGILVAGAERGLRFAFLRSAGRPELVGLLLGVARYLAAGALLAWRLG